MLGHEGCLVLMVCSNELPSSRRTPRAPLLLYIHGPLFVAGDAWAHGLSLPEQFWDASGYGVNLALETDLPYLEHEKVFAHYAELQQLISYHEEVSAL